MEKHVIKWTYWLGTVCAVLALSARGFDILGINPLDFSTRGSGIGYHSFMDGTLFFYVISIATASYVRFISQKQSS